MVHVSRTHRVALDWLFDRINLDPKIQTKYSDTKNQLADILTKGNFTRDEWNHLLCLFNISHFSPTNYLEVMSKKTQEDAGEERCRVRDPTLLASTASENPGNTKSESQIPLSSWNEQQPRTMMSGAEKPAMLASSPNSSEWNIDDKWSSQVWKSGEMSKSSAGKPVSNELVIDDDRDSDTATESNLSQRSHQWLQLCVARLVRKNKHGETRSKTNDFKYKFACILEADESTRLRMEESLPNHHEDHFAGKGDNSLQHYSLVHKCIPMPQAMKIPAAKAAVDKE